MSTSGSLLQILASVFRLAVVLWNISVVFLNVMRSAIEEAKQESAELMALLDDSGSALSVVRSSLGHDKSRSENPWQMLIIAKVSSFVLLLRLSDRRVLHLEVDEKFIAGKLEVIQTDLGLQIEHVPRMLCLPVGMHDTRLVRYTPMKLPYLWRETTQVAAERSIVAAAAVSRASEGEEVRADRKKYVQLLAESALRRRMQMKQLELEPKKGMASKKRVLANAMNTTATEEERRGVGLSVGSKVRMERGMQRTRGENRENHAEQLRRVALQSLRRKRGQFDLYTQGVLQEFSFLSKN